MGRPSNTEERREQITTAFQIVLAEQGYEGATIAEVAKTAGLGQGLVHYHFGSKLDILVALVKRIAGLVQARYERRLEGSGASAMERLWAFIDAHVALDEHADPSAVAAWVTIGAEAVCQPEVRAPYAAALEHRIRELARLFSAVLRERGRTTRGARDMAAAVASTIEGSFQIHSVSPEALPRGFASRALRKMVLGMLDGEP